MIEPWIRDAVKARHPDSERWRDRVDIMGDMQVYAIYMRMLEADELLKKAPDPEPEQQALF